MQANRRSGLPLASPLAFLAVMACALVAAAFPLTGTPGPEAAQLLAAVGGPALLFAAASRGAARLDRGYSGDMAVQGLLILLVFAAFVGVITVAGFRHESCAPGRGFLPFVSLSLPVLLLNSALGLWIGRLLGHARVAAVACLLLLGGYLLWLALDWYLDPSFRILSHLTVVIEGDLLRGRALSPAGWAYRMATLLLALGLGFAGASRFPRARSGGLSAAPTSNPGYLVAAAVLIAIAAVTHWQAVDRLAPTRAELEDAYSLERLRGQLIVRANPLEVSGQQVDAILAEGALWLDRLERRMGVKPSEPITIWLHKDSATLGRWTGADHVHFALPMRGELHIADAEVPHRSLGHELVHVVGAELSDTLLGVPGRFGLLVNSGLVEGMAMAMTPELEIKRDLTLREKAAAMRRADLEAIDPLDLFHPSNSMLNFWRHNPGRAYVTAGALMEALAAAKGIDGLQAVYREGDLAAAFGGDEEALKSFLSGYAADLDAMTLPSDAIAAVARTYARPSILDETCDTERLEAADAVRAAAAGGDFDGAEALARAAEDAINGATYVALAQQAEAVGDEERAARYFVRSTRTGDTNDPIALGLRRAVAGDALWRVGKRREAIGSWERVEDDNLPPYARRLVVSKRWLANRIRSRAGHHPLAEACLELILQDDLRTDDAARLGRLAAEVRSDDGRDRPLTAFARYLVARQYIQRGALDEGLDMMLRVVEDGLPASPFDEEVYRGLAMGHARRGDLALAEAGFTQIADDARRAAVRVLMRDRAERVQRMRAAEGKTGPEKGDRWLLGRSRMGGL